MSHDYRKTPEAIARLSPLQRKVTQEDATEPAFRNEFWNNHEPGLYVDGIGGMRYERNYLITETGFQTLTNHEIRIQQ